MIQRKQTLWLSLIFLVCTCSVYWNINFRDVKGKLDGKVIEDALASVGFSHTAITVLGKDRVKTEPNTILKYCTLSLGFCALISIFLFSRRPAQLALGKVIYVLTLAMAVLMYYYGWSVRYVDLEPDSQIVISSIFPFLLAWFNFRAIRAIKHDEDLVKSYDRIR